METQQTTSSRGEIVKFLILVLVMAITVGIVAWSRPLIFNQIVPAVLGEGDAVTAEEAGDDMSEEAIEEEADNDEAMEGGETAVDEEGAADDSVDADDNSAAAEDRNEMGDEETTHVVQPGDTLYAIARRYDVTVSAIVNANKLRNPNRVTVGQRLIIPKP